jgi:hypothetical protein
MEYEVICGHNIVLLQAKPLMMVVLAKSTMQKSCSRLAYDAIAVMGEKTICSKKNIIVKLCRDTKFHAIISLKKYHQNLIAQDVACG